MREDKIIKTIQFLKPKYKKLGIEILGIVGSYARGDFKDNSDVDILYKIEDKILLYENPFKVFSMLNDFKRDISQYLQKKINIIDISTLNDIAKKYMLKDKIDV